MSTWLLTWLLAPLAFLRLALTQKSARPANILLIQTAKIGDYICTTPIIVALHRTFPDARLSLLINPLTEPLARQQAGVTQVFCLPEQGVRGLSGRLWLYRFLRRERFDTTICISPNQSFLLLPFLAGVGRRASILPNFNGRSYRRAIPFLTASETHQQGRMMVETGMALIRQLGVEIPLPAKEISPSPGASQRVQALLPATLAKNRWIGLGISSGNKMKALTPETLQALISGLLELQADIGVVLVGSSADRPLAIELQTALPAPTRAQRLIDSTGQVALEDLAAFVDTFSLYLGVDSGITYLADARGIPVIDLMGPADAEDQRPTGPKAIVIRPELPCAPCSHAFSAPYKCRIGNRACVSNIEISSILAAVQQRIDLCLSITSAAT